MSIRPNTALLCLLAVLALANLMRERGYTTDLESSSSSSSSLSSAANEEKNKDKDNFLCTRNPYATKLADNLETITQRMDDWLSPGHYEPLLQQAQTNETWQYQWNAFDGFVEMTKCPESERQCIGGHCGSDESKISCGLSGLQPGCIVYSIGGNNQWRFELDVLKNTPCQVHTFDCTGHIDRFKVPERDRLHFHHICLGTQPEPASVEESCHQNVGAFPGKCGATMTLLGIQELLGHAQIDLYKMDIEGFEVPLFRSWPELSSPQGEDVALPMQLLVEIHYRTGFKDLWAPGQTNKRQPFITPAELVQLQRRMINMGYVVVERDDNAQCPHCTELTLVRARCPASVKG